MPEPCSCPLLPGGLQRIGDARVLVVDARHELGHVAENPHPCHRLDLLTQRRQPPRPEHPRIGLESVRRAPQLLRVRVPESASEGLDQSGPLTQEGVDELDDEVAVTGPGVQLLERFRVQDAVLASRWRRG